MFAIVYDAIMCHTEILQKCNAVKHSINDKFLK